MDQVQQSRQFLTAGVLFECFLVLVALALGWLFGQWPLERVELGREHWISAATAAGWGTAAALPMFAMLLAVEHIPWKPFRRLRDYVSGRVMPMFQHASLLDLAVISIVAGIGEEMLFRGFLQDIIGSADDPLPWQIVAVTVASVVFGMMHFITPTYAVLATLIGAYLGVLYLWTGSLIAPIVTHSLYDFGALAYFTRKDEGDEPEDATESSC